MDHDDPGAGGDARARVGDLQVRAFVPDGLGAAALDAMRRAVDDPFPAALRESFRGLAALDRGAYWVVRELRVQLDVPASDPDPQRQAGRIATGLARAVEQVVALGPGPDAVRFASRADYVAGYVRARVAYAAGGWVYQRLDVLAALPPAEALIAATRVAGCTLIEAVAALVAEGGWQRLLDDARPESAARLAAAIERAGSRVAAPAELVRSARIVLATADDLPVRGGAAGVADRRLRLLGRLAAIRPLTAEVVAAVWATTEPGRARPEPHRPGTARPGDAAAVGRPPEWRGTDRDAGRATGPADRPPSQLSWLTAPGAVAFLLLPDLVELLAEAPRLAGPDPAAARVRACVLRGVWGDAIDPEDPLLGLAAGVREEVGFGGFEQGRADEGDVAGDLEHETEVWAAGLAADPVRGWRHAGDPDVFSLDSALGQASATLFRRFARHLPGFGQAGAAYLIPRVLPLGGQVSITPPGSAAHPAYDVTLPTCELQVLLALAGLDALALDVGWLDRLVIINHEDGR